MSVSLNLSRTGTGIQSNGRPRARRNSDIWLVQDGPWATSGLAASQTWQTQIACRFKPYAVRVGYHNHKTAALTVDKTTITPATTYSAGGTASGGTTPANVLFSGAASVTVPASSSTSVSAISVSDWTAITPRDRSDVADAPYLFHIRSWIQTTTGYDYVTVINAAGYSGNSSSGLVRLGGYVAGDHTDNTSSVVNTGLFLPVSVQFAGQAECVQVLALGDSLTVGSQASSGGQLASAVERACNLLNTSTSGPFYSCMNLGWSSQDITQFPARLDLALAKYTPDIVVLPTFSPNSQITSTANYNLYYYHLLYMIEKVRLANAVPVLWTGTPKDASSASDDTNRKAWNVEMKRFANAAGISIVDIAAYVGDGANPEQWLSAYRQEAAGSGIHFNDASTDLFASMLAAVLPIAR